MSNHRIRTINYTPRYTYWQALALLPPELRWALREYRKAASRLGQSP